MNTAIEERIRTRAYELWEGEGRPEGREVDHWLRAAQEVAAEEDRPATRARKPRTVATTAAKRTPATSGAGATRSRARAPKGTAPLS
ncbi:MAG TPA: DUF2934 domain-containing protein [Candidatus Dormibacteraeota bacterium]|nr:DUF2934 domain-containing protein [Candidatus Dormibacteraeota bacterium]